MFSVTFNNKSKEFSSKDHAIKYMERLDVPSTLWFGTSTMLMARIENKDHSFRMETFNYDYYDENKYDR